MKSIESLSLELHDILYGTGRTLATAESCTGGGIAAAIVATSGSSDYFKGGIVSYCNEVKEQQLGVKAETIETYNVVSSEVAREMCLGVMAKLNTDYAISITGCAGPGGGSEEIPVGTIWIGYGSKDDVRTYRITKDFGRTKNLKNATKKALGLMVDFLGESCEKNLRSSATSLA